MRNSASRFFGMPERGCCGRGCGSAACLTVRFSMIERLNPQSVSCARRRPAVDRGCRKTRVNLDSINPSDVRRRWGVMLKAKTASRLLCFQNVLRIRHREQSSQDHRRVRRGARAGDWNVNVSAMVRSCGRAAGSRRISRSSRSFGEGAAKAYAMCVGDL